MCGIRVVISGGGKVGSFLADALSKKGHAVTVIERNNETCQKLAEAGSFLVINGDACDFKYQEQSDVGGADVFAAVTGDDDDNLVACQLAKIYFNVQRTVARINNPKNERIFNKLGVDAISSTTVISQLIEERASIGDIITLHSLKKGELEVIELDIPESASNSIKKPIKELGIPKGSVIVSVIRGDDVFIPHGGDYLARGDTIIAVTEITKELVLKNILTK